MIPADCIKRPTEEGFLLAISGSGSTSARGDKAAIDRWQPATRRRKGATIFELLLGRWRVKVLAMLRDNPGICYTLEVVDANTDFAVVSGGIGNVAIFEMNIPQAYYHAITLLELIEKLAGGQHANA